MNSRLFLAVPGQTPLDLKARCLPRSQPQLLSTLLAPLFAPVFALLMCLGIPGHAHSLGHRPTHAAHRGA
jgi:hypothetical protein